MFLLVCLCELLGDVLEHLLHAVRALARRLVHAAHQVVALLAERVHVRVGHADPGLEVELVAATEIKMVPYARLYCVLLRLSHRNIFAFSA